MHTTNQAHTSRLKFPLLQLINPREQSLLIVLTLSFGVFAGVAVVAWFKQPFWVAAATVLASLLVPGVVKWRADVRRFGLTAAVLSVLVMMQGFHGIEHVVQWIQYHLLGWPFFRASGLISAANAEWVHFVWNWIVLGAVVFLMRSGMRNLWAWALFAWATAHTLEHTYLMARYVLVLQDLRALGITDVAAQGLPGVLGRDGWLATSDVTRNTFFCRLPGITTAVRLDVHFWWNVGETALLIPAANVFMRDCILVTQNSPIETPLPKGHAKEHTTKRTKSKRTSATKSTHAGTIRPPM